MINYNTIISNFNKRGTLLKWLKTLNEAVENGALETVTTTTSDNAVIFHFTFADGTSVDSPPIELEAGPAGEDATIEIGTVTTLEPGSDATVTNSGTSSAAIFNFGIPKGAIGQNGQDGQDGQDGEAATIAIGTVTTLEPGSDATVTNSGTSSAAIFNFGIPKGATGNPGQVIEQIVPIESTTTASRPYETDDYFVNNLGILVQATANIALGATIDSTNTTTANKTLAEALNLKAEYTAITPQNCTNSETYGNSYYATYGNLGIVHVGVNGLTANTNTVITVLPIGMHPKYLVASAGVGGSMVNACKGTITTSGIVTVDSSDTSAAIDFIFLRG